MTIYSNQGTDFVYALAAIPGGAWFAARESGLYRSIDDGATWHSLYDSLGLRTPLSTTALALSPDFAQDMTLFSGVSGGILRSTDGGQSWDVIAISDPPPEISSLVVSPAFSADGFALATAFSNGTYYSTDRGTSWLSSNYSLIDFRVTASAISPRYADDRTVLIGTETGAFHSTNGGRSWNVTDLPYVAALSVAIAPDGVMLVGTEGDGLYLSHDAGKTWTRPRLNSRLTISHILAPASDELLVIADTTLYRSTDGGATWRTTPLRTSVAAATVLDEHRLLIGMTDGTIQTLDLP